MKNKYYLSDEEFETFLKEIGGLDNGYRTGAPPITDRYYFSVSNGWLGLIKELIEKSIELGWDKQICQVKEKFGGLRFYINSAPPEVHDVITEYENLSYEVCEECGNPGKTADINGWWSTRCKDHNE